MLPYPLKKTLGFGRNQIESMFRTCRLYDKQRCAETGESDSKSKNFNPEYRYEEILNTFTMNAQRFFNPNRHLAIDESMDKFTVRIF